jgi:predicted nuclease with TOPRIM domain
MGLSKRGLEEINEELVLENRRLRAEVERLTATLSSSSGRLRELEELYARLTRRYARLRSLLIAHLDASA